MGRQRGGEGRGGWDTMLWCLKSCICCPRGACVMGMRWDLGLGRGGIRGCVGIGARGIGARRSGVGLKHSGAPVQVYQQLQHC